MANQGSKRLNWIVLLAAPILACAACSLLLDRSSVECRTAADCLSFGAQPSCQNGACVGGEPCFYGTPTTNGNYLGQCTTANCLPYDNCTEIGLCRPDAALPPAQSPPAPIVSATGLPGDAGLTLCTDMPSGNAGIVYVTGSSNFPTLLNALAPLVVAGVDGGSPGPSIVWQQTDSCTGVARIESSQQTIYDPPEGGTQTAQFYGPGNPNTPVSCSLGPNGHTVDIGESDVYPTTCDATHSSTTATDHPGPIQGMGFVVNSHSSQASISREAAFEAFGTGMASGISPWNDPQRFYVRSPTTGTQLMIGRAIGVAANQFWGVNQGSAEEVHDQLAGIAGDPAEADQAIGIISVDVYDNDRSTLRVLAYQHSDQKCGFLPDSTADSRDKKNIRDGHYWIWGPLHFVTQSRAPTTVLGVADLFSGASTDPAVLTRFIRASLVPQCAMGVQRSSELGDLTSVNPTCECFFEANVVGGAALDPQCTKCASDVECAVPGRTRCTAGFCEAPPQ